VTRHLSPPCQSSPIVTFAAFFPDLTLESVIDPAHPDQLQLHAYDVLNGRCLLRLRFICALDRWVLRRKKGVLKPTSMSFNRPFVLLLLLAGMPEPWLMGQTGSQGQWTTQSVLMPINPVHAALMNNGKILVVAGSGNCPPTVAGCPTGAPFGPANNSGAVVYDPVGQTIIPLTVSWDMFCNGMVILADGSVHQRWGEAAELRSIFWHYLVLHFRSHHEHVR